MAKNSQLNRQWQLLKILETFRFGITIEELTQKAECSRRTIERDLAELVDTGFPISNSVGDFGKKLWKLEKNFLESDKFVVNPTEMVSIHLAKQCLSSLTGTCFGQGMEQLLKKITALLPQKALEYFLDLDDSFYVKHFDIKSNEIEIENLETIRKAIESSKVIQMEYTPDQQNINYTVEFHPYGLIMYEGSMYMIGMSLRAQDLRTFKVKRLRNITILNKTFQKPEDFSLERCVSSSFGIMYNQTKKTTIRCKFTDWATRLLREQKWHRTQIIEKDTGQELIASFLLNTTTEFKRWILGFGHYAKVLEPKSLRKSLVEELQETLDNYSRR